MPLLIVKTEAGERGIRFDPGQSLRSILNETDLQIRSACRGIGACGLCRVRIETGEIDEPTPNEYIYLSNNQIVQGIRLACQVMPKQDLTIVLINPLLKSNWRSLTARQDRPGLALTGLPWHELPQDIKNPYGVAVDLGTTHISLSLYELAGGQFLAGRYGLNPQRNYGSDVMSRLVAATESPLQARELSQFPIQAISEALLDMGSREGINLQQVVRVTLVGNTAMLTLLSGRNYDLLIQPSHWMHAIDCLPEDTKSWAASWSIHPQARIEVMPPLAGFVGSDLLAGVLATRLTDSGAKRLFIDFGTNSEIALWDGQVLWVTSAAGGPAFEGSGISCGMPAEPGAIFRVNFIDNGIPDLAVIAGSEASGLCGSGMVDLIAHLVKLGRLSTIGRFAAGLRQDAYVLVKSDHPIILTKSDIDLFQRAKAAIGAGIEVLLTRAGITCEDLQSIHVGGAFGHFLNVDNAQGIGLLPNIHPNRVKLCGNAALAGCEQVLLSSTGTDRLKRIMEQTKFVNLAQSPDFNRFFFENLFLQPMENV